MNSLATSISMPVLSSPQNISTSSASTSTADSTSNNNLINTNTNGQQQSSNFGNSIPTLQAEHIQSGPASVDRRSIGSARATPIVTENTHSPHPQQTPQQHSNQTLTQQTQLPQSVINSTNMLDPQQMFANMQVPYPSSHLFLETAQRLLLNNNRPLQPQPPTLTTPASNTNSNPAINKNTTAANNQSQTMRKNLPTNGIQSQPSQVPQMARTTGEHPMGTTHVQQQQKSAVKARKEIYRFQNKEPLFAANWSNKVDFRLVAGTILENDQIIMLIEMADNGEELVKKATIPHGYASSKLQFIPNPDPCLPELIASATIHLKIFKYDPKTQRISEECNLCSKKSNVYSSPLTGLDWNEVEPALIGTSSIDTTCTIWNIEVGKAIGQTPAVQGQVKTQLIAHEKAVHGISFSRLDNGKDQFATAGEDGSIRLFDLRALQHSTILYEDSFKRPLNHLAWNKIDHNKVRKHIFI